MFILLSRFIRNNGCKVPNTRLYHWQVDHLENENERSFIETIFKEDFKLTAEVQHDLARTMLLSETFDFFMTKRFGQVKRYGLEGAEGMMVAMNSFLNDDDASSTAVIGMPHRGRLNVLTGLLKYPSEGMFAKILGGKELPERIPGSGDVLSHLWTDTMIKDKRVILLPNPSHLEAVNPVTLGVARHFINIQNGVLPIQVHGDAAFSGQGIVQETLLLSGLPGFKVGGSVHIIVNNQLGFTTPSQLGRSSKHASDPLKMIDSPVVHVSGDDPEGILRASRECLMYRHKFKKDVLINIDCYRRHGHNELDEPSFTQPVMYRKIRSRDLPGTLYAKKIGLAGIDEIKQEYYQKLDLAVARAKEYKFTSIGLQGENAYRSSEFKEAPTVVNKADFEEGVRASVTVPEGFNLHPRLLKMHVDSRMKQIQTGIYDWPTAEAAAMYCLLKEGHSIRLSGQDVGRGTFSQRHAIVYDQQDNSARCPLSKHGQIEIVDSPLSELAVLGFEYGQSLMSKGKLCIWEAQFGDFVNGAQVIIDTFLTSGEQKWGLQSGLTLLLPHGYSGGTGPEHSSCRIERFLQSSDEPREYHPVDNKMAANIQVCQPTTPANYFHLLRRQVKRETHAKPLVIASAKQLLRSPNAVSRIEDFTESGFRPIIYNLANMASDAVIFTSGELAYELERELPSTLIVRLEQLCPFPWQEIIALLQRSTPKKKFVYVQPEPENMGAFLYVKDRLEQLTKEKLIYIGRPPAAAPASGYPIQHQQEQLAIIKACKDLISSQRIKVGTV